MQSTGLKDVFGLPTGYSMEAIGLKAAGHKALDDLIRWGFIELRAKIIQSAFQQSDCFGLKSKSRGKRDEVALVFKANAEPSRGKSRAVIIKLLKTV